MPTKLFAIPGLIGVGFSNVDHEVDTQEEVDAHLASGAFALSAEEAKAKSPLTDPAPAKKASKE